MLNHAVKGLPRKVNENSPFLPEGPGDGALTAAPAKRVIDDRPAVVHRRAVDAASRQVGQGGGGISPHPSDEVATKRSQVPTHTGQDDVFFEAVSFAVNHAGSQRQIYRTHRLPETRFPD